MKNTKITSTMIENMLWKCVNAKAYGETQLIFAIIMKAITDSELYKYKEESLRFLHSAECANMFEIIGIVPDYALKLISSIGDTVLIKTKTKKEYQY